MGPPSKAQQSLQHYRNRIVKLKNAGPVRKRRPKNTAIPIKYIKAKWDTYESRFQSPVKS